MQLNKMKFGACCLLATATMSAAEYTDKDGLVYEDGSKTVLLDVPDGNSGHFAVPEGVLTIGSFAFDGCEELTSIAIPASVKEIQPSKPEQFASPVLKSFEVSADNKAYSSRDGVLFDKRQTTLIRCPRAKSGSYSIPDGVKLIEADAFAGCSELTTITIPKSVTEIWSRAFQSCENLADVVIPNGVSEIGRGAFEDCANLRRVSIPGSVKEIGREAFNGCTSLESVTIGKGVEVVGWDAFSGCESLKAIDLPAGVREIQQGAFGGCSSLRSVIIPESVKEMGDYVFSDCSSLATVKIPPRFFDKLHDFGLSDAMAAKIRQESD